MRLIEIVTCVTMALGVGCVPPGGTYGSTYTAAPSGTGVYVNGVQLEASVKAQLDDLLGESLPPGRYTVDAEGNMAIEGQPPRVNLVALARQREGVNLYSQDSAGRGSSIVSQGNCTILSTPDGSLSSGC